MPAVSPLTVPQLRIDILRATPPPLLCLRLRLLVRRRDGTTVPAQVHEGAEGHNGSEAQEEERVHRESEGGRRGGDECTVGPRAARRKRWPSSRNCPRRERHSSSAYDTTERTLGMFPTESSQRAYNLLAGMHNGLRKMRRRGRSLETLHTGFQCGLVFF